MRIIPAILSDDFGDFLSKLRQAESFADYVQVDLMDGVFVPTRSFPPEKLSTVRTPLALEVHLMVQRPGEVMETLSNDSLRTVLFHVESEVDHLEFIHRMKARGLAVGLAVKPETGIDRFRDLVQHVDILLFLTVDPCCYGNPFKPEVLDKVAEARKLFPHTTISVDGGVTLERLPMFMDLGVDYACVGSKIFLDGAPEDNYRTFMEKVRLLETGSVKSPE